MEKLDETVHNNNINIDKYIILFIWLSALYGGGAAVGGGSKNWLARLISVSQSKHKWSYFTMQLGMFLVGNADSSLSTFLK